MIKKTSHSKVYYIDTFAQRSTHEMFNSSLILMCSMVFDNVNCNISESSLLAFKNIIATPVPSNISFNNIFVVSGESKSSLFLRYLLSALQNIRYLVKSPKNSIIIFPFNNLFSLRILNFLNKILKRKIIIFCHGEMEGLLNDASEKGRLHAILIKLAKGFFLNPKVKISEGIYFSVMGDILKENLASLIAYDKVSKFISIDHPYIFKETVHKLTSDHKVANVGTVGTFNKLKGMDAFTAFVTCLVPDIRKGLNISVTGRILEDTAIFKELNIDILPENKSLSREDFNLRIENLDLILFFYPSNNYKITASAAIIDAILHEKPILALQNDYFVYLFKKFGEFGFLFKNTAEMTDKLYELINNKILMDFDFSALKQKLTPATLSTQLKGELSRIGYLTI